MKKITLYKLRIEYGKVLFFLFLCMACKPQGIEEKISVEIRDNTSCPDSLYFDDCRVVFLDTQEDCVLSQVSKVICSNNKLYVLDTRINQILVFSAEGKFLSQLVPYGRGPWESTQLMDMSLDEQSQDIVVYSVSPGKFMFFDKDGEFKYQLPCEQLFWAMVADKDRHLWTVNMDVEDMDNYLTSISYDSSRIIRQEKIPLKQNKICDIFAEGRLMLRGKETYFTKRYDNTVYKINRKRIEKVLQVDFGENNFPEQFLNRKMDELEFTEEIVKNRRAIYSLVNVKGIGDYLFAGSYILGIFVLDTEAKTGKYWNWVENHRLGIGLSRMIPLEDDENRWIGFKEDIGILKSTLKYRGLSQAPEWFKEKIKTAAEDNNPVLFLYRVKV